MSKTLKWLWIVLQRAVGLVVLVFLAIPIYTAVNDHHVISPHTSGRVSVITIILLGVMWAISRKVWSIFVLFLGCLLGRILLNESALVATPQWNWAWLDILVLGLCLVGASIVVVVMWWKKNGVRLFAKSPTDRAQGTPPAPPMTQHPAL
jgi:hypothetical protein